MDTITAEKQTAVEEAFDRLVSLLIASAEQVREEEDGDEDDETDDPGTWHDEPYDDEPDYEAERSNRVC
jgi:hypothetical protein